ncbi:sodium-dependent phosphate transport protein 2B isoform X2 [Folsomia candida]|uniref:sodium-dependent phosphate transport protein 2B isoform X2 n=1 Tax=Folsomia candida TaxID=158441 RepID=UPI000B8F2616|nr:sodium-dependent phosphate transport protein 2B isoform X2 [Folsomia candida]
MTKSFYTVTQFNAPPTNGKHQPSTTSSTLDPWSIASPQTFGAPWNELTPAEKRKRVVIGVLKAIGLMCLLYFFVCSLDLLSLGFRIVGGRTTGDIFRDSPALKNPVVGVMVGILTTVMVQSSSTSTSIIVSMVSASFLDVKQAIPIIMGANIGTSITNTIVSLTQAGDRNQFRRAFAGATVHDMFNWLTVITLLIVEVTTNYLYHVTTAIMDSLIPTNSSGGGEIELLGKITKPFVNLIVQIDKEVLECWAKPDCTKHENSSLIKDLCKVKKSSSKQAPMVSSYMEDFQAKAAAASFPLFQDVETTTALPSGKEPCSFLFHGTSLSDAAAGAIILVVSLVVLCLCLILIVKILNSVLQGQIALIIKKTLNAKIPYVPWITGYIAILVGAVMTFLVQSSSVFTSALTPLVGLGVLTVERVYPLTLGSNIGTTTTALLASMAVEGDTFKPSMQIALCHLLFNVTGILIFYPIPFLRWPIAMSKFLGDTTAKYRWFAIVYMVAMFVFLPGVFMGLSFAGTAYVIVAAGFIVSIFLFVLLVNLLRAKRPSLLPGFLLSWKWLPIWFRSLAPYDAIFTQFACCKKLKEKNVDPSRNNRDTELTMSDEKVDRRGVGENNSHATGGNVNLAFSSE